MKINSIRFTLAMTILMLIGSGGASIVFFPMDAGGREVIISMMSILSTALITILNSLLRKTND